MAMGKRKSEQAPMWVAATELPISPGHPFYVRLNEILDAAGFDRFVEEQCRSFYAPVMGRPSLAPGRYFRLLLIGYFEGLDSERGIAWRAADSLAVRQFLGLGLDEAAPDHSTISRTRRLIDIEAHQAVFTWVQERLVEAAARRSPWMRPRLRPTPRCAASCGGTRGRATRSSSRGWRRPRASRPRAVRRWLASTGDARSGRPMPIGGIPRILMPRSRR